MRKLIRLPAQLFKRLVKLLLCLGIAFSVVSVLLVLLFRWQNPPSSAFMLAWEASSGQTARQHWKPLREISPNLQMAVIASEDQKFPVHYGFDLVSIQKALTENSARPRGASTITQQTAKNLFLWGGRSYLRKAMEAWYTLLLETLWPKQRILEVYLNIAEFGEGVYGAEAASKQFFYRSAKRLTRWQAGLLAAVLPSPKRMSAKSPSDYVEDRARTISNQIRTLYKLEGVPQLIVKQ